MREFLLRFTALVVIAALQFTGACTAGGRIAKVEEVKEEQPIEVVTKSGNRYRFERWHLGENEEMTGFAEGSGQEAQSVRIIPKEDIEVITLFDRTAQTIATIALVGLCVAAVIYLWKVFDLLGKYGNWKMV